VIKTFPSGSKHNTKAVLVDGANVQLIKWYVLGNGGGEPIGKAEGVAAFEMLTSNGTTLKLADCMDNGWMSKPEHVEQLLAEINIIIDELIDFQVELQQLRPSQLEMFSMDEMGG
jgi:hypothetical protein